MSNITCGDCGAKKLDIWFDSRNGKRDLCSKCYLLDVPEGKKK